ncbi:MAG: hypothetical protein AAGA75_11675 [Cyanobacteria bacterium P01_E01_bin.6]
MPEKDEERNPQRQVTLSPEVLVEFEEVANYLKMPVRSLIREAVHRFHSSQDFENWLRRARENEQNNPSE